MDQKPLTKEQLKNREGFTQEMNDSLKKRNLVMMLDVDFPQYKELPEEVLLALKVMENHKGKFMMRLLDTEKALEPKKGSKK